MDFIAALLLYAQHHDISDTDAFLMHQHYCENLYWQPNSEEKLKQAECDISYISQRISDVQHGKNPDSDFESLK